jgi:hypothetical protein
MTHCPVNHHATDHLVFGLVLNVVSLYLRFAEWYASTRCVRITLTGENREAVEIHCERQNIMSEGTVRQWCTMLKDGQANVHDEERSVRPAVMSDDLVQSVDEKFVKEEASQIQNFHVNFHKFCTLLSTRLS